MKISESKLRAIIRAEARRLFEGGEFPEEKYGHHDFPFDQEPGPEGFGDEEDDEDYEDEEVARDENAAEMMADMDEPLGIDEARKRGGSVIKKGGKKASAGSVSIFKKAAAGAKGGEEKKKGAGFKAVKKSAEKWADNPAAVAQAATMVATGEPVVAKGEKKGGKKRKLKESTIRAIVSEAFGREDYRQFMSKFGRDYVLQRKLGDLATNLYDRDVKDFESFLGKIKETMPTEHKTMLRAFRSEIDLESALESWYDDWYDEYEAEARRAEDDREELAYGSGQYGGFIP